MIQIRNSTLDIFPRAKESISVHINMLKAQEAEARLQLPQTFGTLDYVYSYRVYFYFTSFWQNVENIQLAYIYTQYIYSRTDCANQIS